MFLGFRKALNLHVTGYMNTVVQERCVLCNGVLMTFQQSSFCHLWTELGATLSTRQLPVNACGRCDR